MPLLSYEQVQVLWDAWLKILKQAACETLKSSAAGFARLGNGDEDVYTCLVALTDTYRHVVTLCETLTLENPEADALLHGICEVLSARLKEFDDTPTFTCGVSPVLQEKCGIIYQALFSLCDEIINEQTDHEIFAALQKNLQLCVSHLDDLHTRTETRLCIETLEREWEELGNIIKLQVAALEAVLDEEDEAVFYILNILRELYQRTAPVVEHIQMLLTSSPVQYEILFDDLTEFSDDGFLLLLTETAATIFDSLQIDKSELISSLMQLQAKETDLAADILSAFMQLREFLPNAIEETPQSDIYNGILETLDIKIDSLKESLELFEQEGQSLAQEFADTKIKPSDKELTIAAAAILAAWANTPPTFDGISAFFEDIASGEIFMPFALRIKKQETTFEEKISRFLFRYKKEVLLYEICTYEEILTHSVSVLEQDTACFYSTFDELQTILEKNEIFPIRPEEHEPFNAFEHDVLVAEEHEGFKKGEIVKRLTTGYKQHDKVIVRANVIAGR